MLDLPMIGAVLFFVAMGFVFGHIESYMRDNKLPFDIRDQWWIFAVWGIFWVVTLGLVVWVFRGDTEAWQHYGELVILFSAALPGMAFNQIARWNGNSTAVEDMPKVEDVKRAFDDINKIASSMNGTTESAIDIHNRIKAAQGK